MKKICHSLRIITCHTHHITYAIHRLLAILDPGMPVDNDTRRSVLTLYGKATVMNSDNYRAWHEWGLANYYAAGEARGRANARRFSSGSGIPRSSKVASTSSTGNDSVINLYLVNAAKGLLRAIALGTRRWCSSVSQDMLAFLSVWFKHGDIPDVYATLDAGLSTVHIDNWLGVLPQLIARIDHPERNARTLLHGLLSRLGTSHAQALVYPLSVALTSPRMERRLAAESLMAKLKDHSEKLIEQVSIFPDNRNIWFYRIALFINFLFLLPLILVLFLLFDFFCFRVCSRRCSFLKN